MANSSVAAPGTDVGPPHVALRPRMGAQSSASAALEPIELEADQGPEPELDAPPRLFSVSSQALSFGELLGRLKLEHEAVQHELEKLRGEISALRLVNKSFEAPPRVVPVEGTFRDECATYFPRMGERHADFALTQRSFRRTSSLLGGTPTLLPKWEETDENMHLTVCPDQAEESQSTSAFSHISQNLRRSNPMPRVRFVVVAPNSPAIVVWDLLGGLLILYDIIVIPLGFFALPQHHVFEVMDTAAMIYWTIHMGCSLCVGFYQRGVLILAPRAVAINYLRGWLLVDVVLVGMDWGFVFLDVDGGASVSSQSVSLLRIVRLARLSRLLRMMKLRRLLTEISDSIDSEHLNILANIVRMIVLLLLVNHLTACLWYAVANVQRGSTWIDHHGFRSKDWGHKYTVAFHWSITQFTPSSMHVQPQNVPERLFAIAVIVFALVGFSYIVGSITGSLAQLRNMQAETSRQFWNLRRHLRNSKVPQDLATRIKRYLEHAWEYQQKTQAVKKMAIFDLLSSGLRSELEGHHAGGRLSKHPFFRQLHEVSEVTTMRLANTAIESRSYSESEDVFHLHERATHMYFIKEGELRYSRSRMTPTNRMTAMRVLAAGEGPSWVSEPALWITEWRHFGNLVAVTDCKLLLLSPQGFADVVRQSPVAYSAAMRYAKHFCGWLAAVSPGDEKDVGLGEEALQVLRASTDPSEQRGENLLHEARLTLSTVMMAD